MTSWVDLLQELKNIKARLTGQAPKENAPTDTVTVDTSATKLLDANSDRGTFVVSHTSSTDVYIGFDSSVSTSGSDSGHVIVSNQPFGIEGYTGAVYAIADSGTVEVTVTESDEA